MIINPRKITNATIYHTYKSYDYMGWTVLIDRDPTFQITDYYLKHENYGDFMHCFRLPHDQPAYDVNQEEDFIYHILEEYTDLYKEEYFDHEDKDN